LHNEEIHNLCPIRNTIGVIKSRAMSREEIVARMVETKNAHNSSIGEPVEKRPFGGDTCTCKDNIKMVL